MQRRGRQRDRGAVVARVREGEQDGDPAAHHRAERTGARRCPAVGNPVARGPQRHHRHRGVGAEPGGQPVGGRAVAGQGRAQVAADVARDRPGGQQLAGAVGQGLRRGQPGWVRVGEVGAALVEQPQPAVQPPAVPHRQAEPGEDAGGGVGRGAQRSGRPVDAEVE